MKKADGTKRSLYKRFMSKLKTSILAAVFTTYNSRERRSIMATGFGKKVLTPAFRAVSSSISSSITSRVLSKIAKYLLSIRLRVFGTALMSFGLYTAVFHLVNNFILSESRYIPDILVGVVAALSSIPLAFSDDTLSSALISSRIGRVISSVTGIRSETIQTDEVRGKTNHGFLVGLALGVMTFFFTPLRLIFAIVCIVAVWLTFVSPEFGLIISAMLLPVIGTGYLTALTAITFVSFILKLVRGKRYVTLETMDVAALGVLLIILTTAVGALVPEARTMALRLALFMTVYYMASSLMRNREWLGRATGAFIFGCTAASVAVIAVYVAGLFFRGMSASASELFGSSLLGLSLSGSISGLNMLLTLAIPLAVSRIISPPEGASRSVAAASAVIMIAVPAVSGSAVALVAIFAALTLLLMIYTPKFVFLPVGLAAAATVSYFAFPSAAEKAVSALSSGFNNFVEVRYSAWRFTPDVLSKTFFAGVGFGDEAFSLTVNPGVSANHVYNTPLQFWISTGIIGIACFALFFWYLTTSTFRTADNADLAKSSPALRGSGYGSSESSAFALKLRMAAAGPYAAAFGLTLYGFADYVFSDERIFLAFWLASGLAGAASRGAREEIRINEASWRAASDPRHSAEAEIRADR
ncbi:MAG: O-antigen ligase family protein [Clostridia bacterium]|nr:O-antigen ligase family protein [Clostridia bacterium]